jgi:hypothetical protein
VEGWHTGREWIDSSYLVERVNFASEMVGDISAPGIASMLERITRDRAEISPDELLDACLYEMGCMELRDITKKILFEELGVTDTIDTDTEEFREVAAQMLRLIVASREYQFA